MNCTIKSDTPRKKKTVPIVALRRKEGVKGPNIRSREGMEMKQTMVTSQQTSGVHSNTMNTIAFTPFTAFARSVTSRLTLF